MIVLVLKRFAGLSVALFLATILGCSDENESNPSDVSGYNYTDYYIAGFRVGSEGDEFPAGGPNIFPKKDGQARSGGGKFICCISIPAHWRPGMKLVVKWRRDTKPYDKDRSGAVINGLLRPPRCRRMGHAQRALWCIFCRTIGFESRSGTRKEFSRKLMMTIPISCKAYWTRN
ncbi:DUF3304 domain-containing protein [Burkholderia multivorans]|uniref:DUF3304 domain-containing protein n=1 Tax=Burkholderia multivorans TaxID=87883 RepID=UPI000A5388B5